MVKLTLAVSILAWLIFIGGTTYAQLFISDELKTELSIMSPRTFIAVSSTSMGWIVSCFALFLSLLTLYVKGKSRLTWISLLLSLIYVIPLGLLYII